MHASSRTGRPMEKNHISLSEVTFYNFFPTHAHWSGHWSHHGPGVCDGGNFVERYGKNMLGSNLKIKLLVLIVVECK